MCEGGDVSVGMLEELLLIVSSSYPSLKLVSPANLACIQFVSIAVKSNFLKHVRRHILMRQLLEYLLSSLQLVKDTGCLKKNGAVFILQISQPSSIGFSNCFFSPEN